MCRWLFPRDDACTELDEVIGKDAIVIGEANAYDETIDQDGTPFFDSITKVADIPIIRGGVVEEHLQVFYCKNFHQSAKPLNDYPVYRQLNGLVPFVGRRAPHLAYYVTCRPELCCRRP